MIGSNTYRYLIELIYCESPSKNILHLMNGSDRLCETRGGSLNKICALFVYGQINPNFNDCTFFVHPSTSLYWRQCYGTYPRTICILITKPMKIVTKPLRDVTNLLKGITKPLKGITIEGSVWLRLSMVWLHISMI